jgi:hypothetical protein
VTLATAYRTLSFIRRAGHRLPAAREILA